MGPSGEESQVERQNRNFAEILQELRVAQTGVQILFAFLLTMVFTTRFDETSDFQRAVYLITLMLTIGATGLLIAPVAYHRLTQGRRMRPKLVTSANRFALGGIAFLVLALTGSVLLVGDVVLGFWPACALAAVAMFWLVLWWYLVPIHHRKDHTR